jgi:SH3 domain protein
MTDMIAPTTGARPRYRALAPLLLAFVLAAAAPGATGADSNTRYISDRLTVPLRTGPSNGHRIIHRGLPAGTQLSVLEEGDNGYVRIRTARGTEGWLESQYLDSQPIARARLASAQQEVSRLKKNMNDQRQQLADLRAGKGTAEKTASSLESQVSSLSKELEDLKAISKNAVANYAENRKLKELNERLRGEVQDLAGERDALQSNAQQRWLMIGGGLVLLGLLLGVMIKARPRSSAWS